MDILLNCHIVYLQICIDATILSITTIKPYNNKAIFSFCVAWIIYFSQAVNIAELFLLLPLHRGLLEF